MKKKNTNQSSLKSNTLQYRESEVDEDLAFKYYKKKIGAGQQEDLKDSSENDKQDQDQDDDYEDDYENDENFKIKKNTGDEYSDQDFNYDESQPDQYKKVLLLNNLYPCEF